MSMTAKQVYNALDDVGFVKELADIKERWDNTDKKDFKPFLFKRILIRIGDYYWIFIDGR